MRLEIFNDFSHGATNVHDICVRVRMGLCVCALSRVWMCVFVYAFVSNQHAHRGMYV